MCTTPNDPGIDLMALMRRVTLAMPTSSCIVTGISSTSHSHPMGRLSPIQTFQMLKTQIVAFRKTLGDSGASDELKSYDLVWLLHLVGDVHQPLHATTRFNQRSSRKVIEEAMMSGCATRQQTVEANCIGFGTNCWEQAKITRRLWLKPRHWSLLRPNLPLSLTKPSGLRKVS